MRATGFVWTSMALLVLGGCSLIVEGDGQSQDTFSQSDQDTTSNNTDAGFSTDDTGPGTDDTGIEPHTGDTHDTGISTGDTGDPDLPVEVQAVVLNNGAEFARNVLVELVSQVRNATQMRLRNDEGPWSQWYPFMAKRNWTLSPEQGMRTVTVEFRNDISGPKEAFDSIILDTIPPNPPRVTCMSGNESYTDKARVLFKWESAGGGTGEFRRKLNDENLEMGAFYTQELSFETAPLFEGHHTLYVQERDKAGNWSASGFDSVYVDLNPPWVSQFSVVDQNKEQPCTYAFGTRVNLRIDVDDGNGIGVQDMRLRNENGVWSSWMQLLAEVIGWEIPSGHGWTNIEVEVRDRFLHVGASTTGVFRDDFYEQCVGNDSFATAWRVERELTSEFKGSILPIDTHGSPLIGPMPDFYAITVPEGSGGTIRVLGKSGSSLAIGVKIYAENGTLINSNWYKDIFIGGNGTELGEICPGCYCTDKNTLYYLEVFTEDMDAIESYDIQFFGDPNACSN